MISKNEYTQKCKEIRSRYTWTGSVTGPNDYVLRDPFDPIWGLNLWKKMYNTVPEIGRNKVETKKRRKKNKESRKQRKINRRLKR